MKKDAQDVLIVEDDPSLRDLLVEELDEVVEPALRPIGVESAEAALRLLARQPFALVISDLKLPGADGFDLLRQIRRTLDEPPPFIMVTAFGTVARAVDALKSGASDFLTKPLDLEHLRISVGRALEARELKRKLLRYQKAFEGDDFHGMLGDSEPMRRLFHQILHVARADGPVLVTGESGTGKELAARAVHLESPRRAGPYVPVNCAGIPGELLESEFFGHVPGAFTGASSRRDGLFLGADKGTLFLDEIASMPLELQAKLLRVVDDGRVRPLGTSQEIPVDVRIVAATNTDLESSVRQHRGEDGFREDLFYRLEAFALRMPPLRERGEDLELLTGHFWNRSALELGKEIPRISAATMRKLREYPFPGNVRELKNAIARAVAFCDGEELLPSHLPHRIRGYADRTSKGEETGAWLPPEVPDSDRYLPLRRLENLYVRHVLDRLGGNKRKAASVLGISRSTLYRCLDDDPI